MYSQPIYAILMLHNFKSVPKETSHTKSTLLLNLLCKEQLPYSKHHILYYKVLREVLVVPYILEYPHLCEL